MAVLTRKSGLTNEGVDIWPFLRILHNLNSLDRLASVNSGDEVTFKRLNRLSNIA